MELIQHSSKEREEWAEWMREELILDTPHRQVVFTIPKMLRIFFKYNRSLLSGLCLHFLVSEGGLDQDGRFHSVCRFNDDLLREIFTRATSKQAAERVGKYMIRPILSLKRLSFDEAQGQVIYQYGKQRTDSEHMDYLEVIARAVLRILIADLTRCFF